MRITPLIQSVLFDVAAWDVDAEFGVFPQGSRAKDAIFAPESPPESILIASKRYLFKRSRRNYPDQFWGEIVAYRIGCLLGVPVPPAFASWNSDTEHCAALIEWFYADRNEAFVMAGDFLQRVQPEYDREHGAQHNLADISRLLRSFAIHKILEPGWLKEGDTVTFELDRENPVDSDALAVVHNGARIGYVNRAMRGTFHHWLRCHRVAAVIDRKNGKPDRPLLYVRVSVT
jgi:hypothetical protein